MGIFCPFQATYIFLIKILLKIIDPKWFLMGRNSVMLTCFFQEEQMLRLWSVCILYCALKLSPESSEARPCKLSHILDSAKVRCVIRIHTSISSNIHVVDVILT